MVGQLGQSTTDDKDALIEALANYLLPGYPFADPFAAQEPAEEEVMETVAELVDGPGTLPMPGPLPMPAPLGPE